MIRQLNRYPVRWLPGSAWGVQVGYHCWLAEDAIQRLQQARVRTRLSTEELLALTRGEDP